VIPSDPAERHRQIAGHFSRLVAGVPGPSWSVPTPVDGWTAHDVVRHLVGWLPGFLTGGCDVRLPSGPGVDDDPAAAWAHHATAVQELLDDPANTDRLFEHPALPPTPLAEAVSRFYTVDVFMHSWDLARATGQDDRLDPDLCRELFAGLEPMEDQLRRSGQFGPRFQVAADADWQTKLLGLIGRDPCWHSP
jgi:uncharacterized protein (TIGR03086 family)